MTTTMNPSLADTPVLPAPSEQSIVASDFAQPSAAPHIHHGHHRHHGHHGLKHHHSTHQGSQSQQVHHGAEASIKSAISTVGGDWTNFLATLRHGCTLARGAGGAVIGKKSSTQKGGHCAHNVTDAINAMQLHDAQGNPIKLASRDAKDMGPELIKAGFDKQRIPADYQPKAGDVILFEATPSKTVKDPKTGKDIETGHPHGHMEVYTAKEWVSDFVQHGQTAYSGKEFLYRNPSLAAEPNQELAQSAYAGIGTMKEPVTAAGGHHHHHGGETRLASAKHHTSHLTA